MTGDSKNHGLQRGRREAEEEENITGDNSKVKPVRCTDDWRILIGTEHNRVIYRLNRYQHSKEKIGNMGDKAICRFSSIKWNYNSTYRQRKTGIITYRKECTYMVEAEIVQGKKERKVTIISISRLTDKQAAAEYKHQKTCARSAKDKKVYGLKI